MRFVLFLITLIFLSSCVKNCHIETKIVEEIGACNKDAYCEVRFADQTLDQEYYPIKGKAYQVRVCKKEGE